ncbi:hypothetical protein A5780_14520 [Nocardia sp. 852002-20019_SCH5090214]|uniref:hypothetical protein n=1 Tax=Nocardia sp. 852002-20019_SCH5090214 TaxID=1834087 RepID=UPI0007FDBD46|nr:hypothetical protein [Nocardia sp. 852002-20019_SCH5090214]OBA66272.1 hypothetical protein A5780_14520 [Nocardia sp. 852002-20019_SCH5090214]
MPRHRRSRYQQRPTESRATSQILTDAAVLQLGKHVHRKPTALHGGLFERWDYLYGDILPHSKWDDDSAWAEIAADSMRSYLGMLQQLGSIAPSALLRLAEAMDPDEQELGTWELVSEFGGELDDVVVALKDLMEAGGHLDATLTGRIKQIESKARLLIERHSGSLKRECRRHGYVEVQRQAPRCQDCGCNLPQLPESDDEAARAARRGRPRSYCDNACRQRQYRLRRKAALRGVGFDELLDPQDR